MFRPGRVLATVDFSDTSRVALVLAARLSTQLDAQLHVLHAEDPLLSAAARTSGIDLAAETRDELSTFVRSAAPAADRAPVLHVATGPPVETICDVAVRERADLLVVGAHGLSGVGRFLFGSVAEGVLRRAPVPVLVVPTSWTPPRPEAVDLTGTGPFIVGFDFSPPARLAAGAACDLAAALQTSVQLVHVVPPPATPGRWRSHADAAVRQGTEIARRDLAVAAAELPATVPVDVRVETGSVHERLAEAATQADHRRPWLVLGRRPPTDRHQAPGATAYRVVGLAQVPVLLLLPSPWDRDGARA